MTKVETIGHIVGLPIFSWTSSDMTVIFTPMFKKKFDFHATFQTCGYRQYAFEIWSSHYHSALCDTLQVCDSVTFCYFLDINLHTHKSVHPGFIIVSFLM